MAQDIGLEPMTYGLEDRCSIPTELTFLMLRRPPWSTLFTLMHRRDSNSVKLSRKTSPINVSVPSEVYNWLKVSRGFSSPSLSLLDGVRCVHWTDNYVVGVPKHMVQDVGLEPTNLTALVPKTSVSANSTNLAYKIRYCECRNRFNEKIKIL